MKGNRTIRVGIVTVMFMIASGFGAIAAYAEEQTPQAEDALEQSVSGPKYFSVMNAGDGEIVIGTEEAAQAGEETAVEEDTSQAEGEPAAEEAPAQRETPAAGTAQTGQSDTAAKGNSAQSASSSGNPKTGDGGSGLYILLGTCALAGFALSMRKLRSQSS